MPSSAVRTFNDPWEYQASFPDADVQTFLNAAGRYQSGITRIELHQLDLKRGWISLPRIAYSAHHKELCNISFHTDAEQAPTMLDGTEVRPDHISFHSLGAELYHRTTAACRWGAVSLTPDNLAAAGRAVVDYELTAPAVTRLIRPSPHLLLRFSESARGRRSAGRDCPGHSGTSGGLSGDRAGISARYDPMSSRKAEKFSGSSSACDAAV